MSERNRVIGWLSGRVPDGWFTAPIEVRVDRDEILVIGDLADPQLADDAPPETVEEARVSRVEAFRADTRGERIRIARAAEHEFGRKVSWGVRIGGEETLFTHLAIPAMTRLRMPERRVLDTLIDGGVARSRSEALAWCVRLVGDNLEPWLNDLRDALRRVHEVRDRGPHS